MQCTSMLDELKQMQVKKSEEKKAIIENTDEITRLKKQLDVYLEMCAMVISLERNIGKKNTR